MDIRFEHLDEISFTRKKVPLSSDLRPFRKISEIVLVLFLNSRSGTASILKLQLFNWALLNDRNQQTLIEFSVNKNIPIIRFNPFLNRAITFAAAEGYISINRGKFSLTDKGEFFAAELVRQSTLLAKEKKFLNIVGKSITESMINKAFKERYNING